ncbi:wall-associated receptor kinase-like 10 [Quercus suber]|uniref:wall-associated receptor kinase-like 10 n=1 Tax=Quercus suber TaxID=58331 RepID=UPI000CE1BEB7|nr:wall-associated receptor kinase-like 10 [Quercus suber]
MKMAVQFVMRITILVLLTYELAEAEAAAAAIVAKPDCNGSCGNLDIPYPFGIGPHCYMDKMFEVVCNGTGSSVKAYLISIDKEVLQINISNSYYYFEPTVQVQMPIIYSNNCRSLGSGAALNISGSPFNFSFIENTFISVGCYNFAKITGLGPVVFGCETHCNKSKTVERTNCSSGFNCCESSYFPYQQEFHVEFKRIDGSPAGEEKACKYAFLVDQNWLQSNKPDPSSVQYWETVPIVLDWAISKRTKDSRDMFKSLKKRPHVRCSFEDEDEDFYSFACKCAYKYQGNPYLPSGCQAECDNKSIEGIFRCKSRLMLAIIVICPSFVLLFLLLIIWWLSKVIKKRNKIKLKQKFFERNGGLLLQQQLSSNENNVQKAKLFNSKELENVTDHFNENRILGKGGQGTVYKGMSTDGRIVAIKKCNRVDEGNLEQFVNEIFILSQINHRNVVKLLGCCLETEVPLLVYEFIPNGTLFQYLHKENEDFPLLTWDMRLRIAIEIAGALSYLHSAASLPIYHRDIKSSNILLDEKYRAKVADFGTSRSVAIDQTHVTTLIYGTYGYLDPEYFQTSQYTEKSDVYSFGVVLIELLTGEKPVSLMRSQEGRNLSTYFVHSLKENRLFDILDTQVSKVCNKDEVITIANLAKRCLHLNGKKRPTMMEIMMELEGVQKVSPHQPNLEEI